ALAAGARVEVVERFDERVDALWRDAAPRHPVIARRDLAFLRWRFDRSPAAQRVTRLYIQRRGQLMGYVVLRADSWRGLPVTVVLDYLVRPGWTLPAFALAVEFARRERTAALLCRTLNPEVARPLAAMGFVCFRNGFNLPTRMMARVGPGAEENAALLSDPANWYVTAADSDLGFTPFDPAGT
ncbi:MAG TPA: GNAT family N-acetyltransferase, partial [Azospirillum sp.]